MNLPVGEARLFASQVGGGFHDGLGVDGCGNLFVADYQTSGLHRVTPDGKVALYQQWDTQTYGHSLSGGSGGWDELSLYLPQPFNDDTVVKVEIGVPARPRDCGRPQVRTATPLATARHCRAAGRGCGHSGL